MSAPATKAKAPARKRPAARKQPAVPVAPPRSPRWFAIALVVLLGLGAAAAVAVSVLGDSRANGLEAFADGSTTPIYWAGSIEGRELELTRTADGTFVRYLPPSVRPGGVDRVLTVATYPVAKPYATAVAQAKSDGMVSREIANGGLAVWSRAQPTSVYVAFPGVAQLVEVYSPSAAEARQVALSGRIKPVR